MFGVTPDGYYANNNYVMIFLYERLKANKK